MSEQNQPIDSLQDVRDIRRLMENSSRFTCLSGLSFIAAGLAACVGAWFAYDLISEYYGDANTWEYEDGRFVMLRTKLLTIAAVLFGVALLTAFYFIWNKARRQRVSLMGHISRRVFWAMAVPLGAGGLFLLGILRYDDWRFIAPGCLLFYGLALLNAGKYTVVEIRMLAYAEILLGLINMQFIGYGFYFWIAGFGVLHLIIGAVMWWRYDRGSL